MSELADCDESPLQYPIKRRSSSASESPAKVRVLENGTGKSIPNMNVIVEIEPLDECDDKSFPLLSQNCTDESDDKQSLLTTLNIVPERVIDENSNKNTVENASPKVLADVDKDLPLAVSQNSEDISCEETASETIPNNMVNGNSNEKISEDASVNIPGSDSNNTSLPVAQNGRKNNLDPIQPVIEAKKMVNGNSNESSLENDSCTMPDVNDKNLPSSQNLEGNDSDDIQPESPKPALRKTVEENFTGNTSENISNNECRKSVTGQSQTILNCNENSSDVVKENLNENSSKNDDSTGGNNKLPLETSKTNECTSNNVQIDKSGGNGPNTEESSTNNNSNDSDNTNDDSRENSMQNAKENSAESNFKKDKINIHDNTNSNNKLPIETSNTSENSSDHVLIDTSEGNDANTNQSSSLNNANKPENTNENSKGKSSETAKENSHKTTLVNAELDASNDNGSSNQVVNDPVNLVMGENSNTAAAENTEIQHRFYDSMNSSICSSESICGDQNERNFILDQDSNDSTFTCDSSVASSLNNSFEKSLASEFLTNRIPHRPDTIRNRINALCSEDTVSDVSETSQRPVRRDSVRKRIDALCRDMIVDIKRKKVDIFTEDVGPKWYEANSCTITKSIVPSKVIEAFNFLPTYGKPKSRTDLHEFLDQKVQEFVGSGLTNEEFSKLQRLCSKDLLKTGKEPVTKMAVGSGNTGFMSEFLPPQMPHTPKIPDGYKLKIIRKHKLRAENDPCNTYTKKLKYRGVRVIPISQPSHEEASSSTMESDLQPGQDLVFTVRIYRPFSFFQKHSNNTKVSTRHSLFSRNVVLLGRQKLTELRDRIVCANDVDMRIDVSDRIDETPPTCAKELFPSGFLFINNVFYVDTRSGCHDTSARLRRWAATRPGLGHFDVRDMAHTTIGEIALKLGHPEVYMHQGNCEHLFTFSDIRLLSPYDPLTITQYPCHTAVSQNQTLNCTTCAEYPAKYITTNSERVPFDPAFFCDTCLRLYLYKNGNKIGDFKTYSYRGNEINMLKPQG